MVASSETGSSPAISQYRGEIDVEADDIIIIIIVIEKASEWTVDSSYYHILL